MNRLSGALLALLSVSSFVASANSGEPKTFNCMDKKSFAINSECMSQNIESNLAFKNAEKAIIEKASTGNDRALASVTFDARTMTIHVVAHKDASIASVDHKK